MAALPAPAPAAPAPAAPTPAPAPAQTTAVEDVRAFAQEAASNNTAAAPMPGKGGSTSEIAQHNKSVICCSQSVFEPVFVGPPAMGGKGGGKGKKGPPALGKGGGGPSALDKLRKDMKAPPPKPAKGAGDGLSSGAAAGATMDAIAAMGSPGAVLALLKKAKNRKVSGHAWPLLCH